MENILCSNNVGFSYFKKYLNSLPSPKKFKDYSSRTLGSKTKTSVIKIFNHQEYKATDVFPISTKSFMLIRPVHFNT